MNKRGFTLIEILVVVSIVGLVGSVALANLQGARDKAQLAAGQQFHASLQHTLGAETIGRWGFDEGSGSVAHDSSGNSLDGTIVGAVYVPEGISGFALSFDGNSYITGSNFPVPGNSTAMTISAWIKPTNIAANNTLFQVGDSGCTVYKTAMRGGQMYMASASYDTVYTDVGEFVPADSPITQNREVENNSWQDIAVVFNTNTVDTYINGTLKGSISTTPAPGCTSRTWSIAGDGTLTVGAGFRGLMDNVQVYGSALTASEIGKEYAENLSKHTSTLADR